VHIANANFAGSSCPVNKVRQGGGTAGRQGAGGALPLFVVPIVSEAGCRGNYGRGERITASPRVAEYQSW